MKLSDQALGAIMLALQNSLISQTDIVPVLKGFELQLDENEQVIVLNPPVMDTEPFMNSVDAGPTVADEHKETVGSD